MTNIKASSGPIVVTGDVTMDWHIANRQLWRNSERGWNQADWTRACWQRGGAGLLADLVEALAEDLRQNNLEDWSILQTGAPRSRVHPGDTRFHHAYALWSRFEDGERLVWRVEEYLGLDRPPGQRRSRRVETGGGGRARGRRRAPR